jgi:hypothetical protein
MVHDHPEFRLDFDLRAPAKKARPPVCTLLLRISHEDFFWMPARARAAGERMQHL